MHRDSRDRILSRTRSLRTNDSCMPSIVKHFFVFAGLAFLLLGNPASGQQINPAVTQSDELQRRQELEKTLKRASSRFDNLGEIAPELFEGELEDVGQQNILKVKRRKRRFDVQIDSQFFYTSNTGLEEDGARNARTLTHT